MALFDWIMTGLSSLIGLGILTCLTIIVRGVIQNRRDYVVTPRSPYLQATPDFGRKVEKGCGHPWSSLIPVESNGEVVAFLCGKCDVWNVELTSPTAIIRLEQDEIKRMKAELRAKADREFSAMFMDPDARAEAIEEATLRKAEIASAAGERNLISRGGTNNIVNRDYGVFTTGYQPSEWDNVR